jgi:hypothetical protein
LTHAQLVCRPVHAPQSRDNKKEPKEIPVRTLRKTHRRHINALPLRNNRATFPQFTLRLI